ncbi:MULTISPECIES: 50S ribosomal protein L25 [Clostridium]|uniref:50S ribosomal protein L25 n=1 Tax=Clostridium TaxID=1485 RepID=UPI00069D58EA|nr:MULTISPECIES: 50S ribosomal protein L25 [Clostridium]KOF55969.1 hypothetical protein AGR56_02915 [Clostridium sp. DMHC 10]MCD2345374.1 50S ribosomal protein L25 [Clostridium guangxiense]
MENLKAEIRNKHGRSVSRKERSSGKIPGVLYSKNVGNIMFDVDEAELNNRISITGEHGFLNIALNGENYKGLIKEIQREPVNHKLIHIDLEDLNGSGKIVSEIPVIFEGEDAIKSKGCVTQKFKNSIKVKCTGDNLPNNVVFDISNMTSGDSLRVCDFEFSKEIAVVDELDTILLSVSDSGKNYGDVELEDNDSIND